MRRRIEAQLLEDSNVAAYVALLEEAGVGLDFTLLDAYNAWSDDFNVKIAGQPEPISAGPEQTHLRS